MPSLPRVLIADPMAHRRLALVDRLRTRFVPVTLPPAATLARAVRSARPDMVLLFVHPLRPGHALRTCRWLKTDVHPIHRVAVINLDAGARSPEAVLVHERADGYWQAPGDPDRLAAFVGEVWEGGRPVVVEPRRRGLLARLPGR